MLAVVYIIAEKGGSPRAQLITTYFESEFVVLSPEIPSPGSIASPTVQPEAEYEWYKVKQCLQASRSSYPDSPCIIMKDSSVSNVDPSTISNIIRNVISQTYDVSYLCKWLDKCGLYTDRTSTGNGTFIARTQSPFGVQALIFSPSGRDIVLGLKPMKNGGTFLVTMPLSTQLNSEIFKGNISATCTVPNLFDFNIFEATAQEDYYKSQQCSASSSAPVAAASSSGTKGYVWFVVIVLFIILIAWALIQVGS